MRARFRFVARAMLVVLATALLFGCSSSSRSSGADPYAKYVWPKPPDKARIRLFDVFTGRVDVEDILDVIFRDFCIGK